MLSLLYIPIVLLFLSSVGTFPTISLSFETHTQNSFPLGVSTKYLERLSGARFEYCDIVRITPLRFK